MTARCVVCGGPYPDGSGCEYCPAVELERRRPSIPAFGGAREAIDRAHAAYLEHERRIPVQLELEPRA